MLHENIGFFVGRGTLSLINAGWAESKGRSELLWWLTASSVTAARRIIERLRDKQGYVGGERTKAADVLSVQERVLP